MAERDLDRAGITDPALRTAYTTCRRLNARHGRTYYLATLLLPAEKRPHVHALYGFARHADEIVDDLLSPLTTAEKARGLDDLARRLRRGDDDGILGALQHTIERWRIPRHLFDDFLASMRMDLETSEYATYEDLMRYVHGSAAVIGLQMVHVLETVPAAPNTAVGYAADLGIAFQLTNFLRDIGDDLRRGRVYLPKEDLATFGVTRDDLESGVVDARTRRLLAHQVARTREVYRSAEPGIRLLHPTSRDCVRTAFVLYAGILDRIEQADYRVLDRRVAVPPHRRARVALPALVRAVRARTAA
jgi:phytoene synthase